MTESDHLYIQKQVGRYLEYSQQSNQSAAEDCLYRIASCLEILPPGAGHYTPEVGQIAINWLRTNSYQV